MDQKPEWIGSWNRSEVGMNRKLSTPSGATGRPAGTLITDGVFGAKSEAMAIWFQRTVGGLTADGLIGLSTWSKLRNW